MSIELAFNLRMLVDTEEQAERIAEAMMSGEAADILRRHLFSKDTSAVQPTRQEPTAQRLTSTAIAEEASIEIKKVARDPKKPAAPVIIEPEPPAPAIKGILGHKRMTRR